MSTLTIDGLPRTIRETFPWQSRFISVNGWRMHYVDEGPRDAPPVLLLHGNPAWGYLWRDVIPPLLLSGYRVVVPDQIGLGLSEKPSSHSAHTLSNHIANLVALVDKLHLRNTAVVCHDWGGPTGLGAVLTRPRFASAVAVMSTWAWPSPSSSFHEARMPWRLMHAPLVGPYLIGRKAIMPGRGMYLSVVDRAKFARQAQAVFSGTLPDTADRALVWIWPRSIPIGEPSDIDTDRFRWLEQGVRALRLPATVIWGQQDEVFPSAVFAEHWHDVWPHAEGTHLVTGRHFLQEDSGPEIGRLLVEFLDRVVPRLTVEGSDPK